MIQGLLPFKYDEVTDGVPWKRSGAPGYPNHYPDISWKSGEEGVANTGGAPDRLLTDEEIVKTGCTNGVAERTFAMLWDYENNGACGDPSINLLYRDERIRPLIKDDEDRCLMERTAQTVIQWLGTNCGKAFINRAERLSKEEVARLQNILHPNRITIGPDKARELVHMKSENREYEIQRMVQERYDECIQKLRKQIKKDLLDRISCWIRDKIKPGTIG